MGYFMKDNMSEKCPKYTDTPSHALSQKLLHVQSFLVISVLIISNDNLSRRENLVLVLTQKSKIRLQIIVEKRRRISPLFHNIFNTYF